MIYGFFFNGVILSVFNAILPSIFLSMLTFYERKKKSCYSYAFAEGIFSREILL